MTKICEKHNRPMELTTHLRPFCPACRSESSRLGALAQWANWEPAEACSKGHQYTPENTAYRKSGKSRICRTCRRDREALPENRAKKRARERQAALRRCSKGHELTPGNVIPPPVGVTGRGRCKTCAEARKVSHQQTLERRAAKAALAEERRAAAAAKRQKEQEWFDWVIPWQVANNVPVSRTPTTAEFKVIMQESRRLESPEIARRVGCGVEKVRDWRDAHPESRLIAADPRELVHPGLR